MKISLNWLKAFLEINCSIYELVNLLSKIGLEVDSIENNEKSLNKLIICNLLSFRVHPEVYGLNICLINNNQKILQIVCDAIGLEVGINVVIAPIGFNLFSNKFCII